MPLYEDWVSIDEIQVDPERVRVLREDPETREDKLADIRDIVLEHLIGSDILEELEFPQTADVIREQLPEGKRARSGDLGEIFATEFIDEKTEFKVPIKRLRYKDHSEMALRGTDVIAFETREPGGAVLKAESKSRQSLNNADVNEAIEDLNRNDGRPSAKSRGFIARILKDQGRKDDWEIVFTTLSQNLTDDDLKHLVFTCSGNNPCPSLTNSEPADIQREFAGLKVENHKDLRQSIFEAVHDELS